MRPSLSPAQGESLPAPSPGLGRSAALSVNVPGGGLAPPPRPPEPGPLPFVLSGHRPSPRGRGHWGLGAAPPPGDRPWLQPRDLVLVSSRLGALASASVRRGDALHSPRLRVAGGEEPPGGPGHRGSITPGTGRAPGRSRVRAAVWPHTLALRQAQKLLPPGRVRSGQSVHGWQPSGMFPGPALVLLLGAGAASGGWWYLPLWSLAVGPPRPSAGCSADAVAAVLPWDPPASPGSAQMGRQAGGLTPPPQSSPGTSEPPYRVLVQSPWPGGRVRAGAWVAVAGPSEPAPAPDRCRSGARTTALRPEDGAHLPVSAPAPAPEQPPPTKGAQRRAWPAEAPQPPKAGLAAVPQPCVLPPDPGTGMAMRTGGKWSALSPDPALQGV